MMNIYIIVMVIRKGLRFHPPAVAGGLLAPPLQPRGDKYPKYEFHVPAGTIVREYVLNGAAE